MKLVSHVSLSQSLSRSARASAIFAVSLLTTACLMVPPTAYSQTQDSSQTTTAPDNSGQNKAPGSTADQQSDRHSDMAITRKIRKSIIADRSLSTYAHNVKIITRHGKVTLKGPVKSEDEKQTIASKAAAVVGSADMVNNQLTVDTSGN